MNIQFLGTSGHGLTLSRSLPSILIDNSILLDCGEGTLASLKTLGLSASNIKAIFLSHLHADHFLGIISLLWDIAFYSNDNRTSPQIYVPEDMKMHLINIIENTFSPFQNTNFELDIRELPVEHSESYILELNGNSYSIDWRLTIHKPICYAFSFNDIFTFSADTAGNSEGVRQLAQRSRILIHEATFFDKMQELAKQVLHSTPSDAAKIANESAIEKLILTHLPEIDYDMEAEFLGNAKKIFSNTQIAHDKMELKLDQ